MEQREAKMAGLTGLFQRGSCYYLRVVLPLNHPLQKTYKNGKFVQSLGRCTYRDAIREGTIKRAQVLYGAVQEPLPIDQSTFQTVAKSAVRHSHWPSSNLFGRSDQQFVRRRILLKMGQCPIWPWPNSKTCHNSPWPVMPSTRICCLLWDAQEIAEYLTP